MYQRLQPRQAECTRGCLVRNSDTFVSGDGLFSAWDGDDNTTIDMVTDVNDREVDEGVSTF